MVESLTVQSFTVESLTVELLTVELLIVQSLMVEPLTVKLLIVAFKCSQACPDRLQLNRLWLNHGPIAYHRTAYSCIKMLTGVSKSLRVESQLNHLQLNHGRIVYGFTLITYATVSLATVTVQ